MIVTGTVKKVETFGLFVTLGGPLFVLQPQRGAELGGDLCLPAARQAPALAQQRVQQGAQALLRALQAV